MKQNMNVVFLDLATFSPTIDFAPIRQACSQFDCYDFTSPDLVVERAYNADIIITNKVVISEKLLSQLPNLKLICVAATGTNNVDLSAAKARSIVVTNASNYAGASVAQYIFAQLLDYFQHTQSHIQNVTQGLWPKSPSFCVLGQPFNELSGKTLGIIGYGHIGQTVASIAKAFGMEILIAERPKAKTLRAGRVSFDDMLRQADIVSLHCPLTANTEGLFNHSVFSMMKPSTVLVNTARGGLINSRDLKQALINKDISYAILDVLEVEPPPSDHLLLQGDVNNLTITAHIAWASQEAQQRLINILANNINGFTNGKIINQVT